jgi:Family of unknown function (DUF6228)
LEEFLIANAAGMGGLLFYDRTPADRAEPINGFSVRVTGHDLAAAVQVYAGYGSSHPGPLFADMARQWAGWSGDLV